MLKLQHLSRGVLPVVVALLCVSPALGEGAFERPAPIRLKALPAIGEKLTPPEPSRFMTMASPSQLYESHLVAVDGAVYDLGLDREGLVRFISTSDPQFRTPEGLKTGDSLAAVRVFAAEKMRVAGGWARYIPLTSGWNAAIALRGEGDALARVVPDSGEAEPDDGYVSFFFRR